MPGAPTLCIIAGGIIYFQSSKTFITGMLLNHIIKQEIEPNHIQAYCTESEYLYLVEKIASQHSIKQNRTNKNPAHFLSFASKFCGHHNQIYPFYDNLVFTYLKDNGYDVKYHDYQKYVNALKKLRIDIGFTESEVTMRHIEYYIWKMKKDENNSK